MMNTDRHIQDIFCDLDFLAGVGEKQKICFNKKCYVDSDSYYGILYRTISGESMETTGILKLSNICECSKQTFYKEKNNLPPEVLQIFEQKILQAKSGLERLARTYDSAGKICIVNSIKNYGIFVLDSCIDKNKARRLSQSLDDNVSLYSDSKSMDNVEI